MADSYAEIVEQYKALGWNMRDQLDFTEQDLKAVSEKAKALYDKDLYEEALELFALLFFMADDNKKGYFAFLQACCLHKMRRYSDAVVMYKCWAALSLDKPYHYNLLNTLLNDCYRNMNKNEIKECEKFL
jgi:tetratricopeptide (TPR) repeat protein